jgi:hypothetical protein
LSNCARQFAPGTFSIFALMPISASDSTSSTQAGSPTVAPPRSKDSVVSKPDSMPASFISARALTMSYW